MVFEQQPVLAMTGADVEVRLKKAQFPQGAAVRAEGGRYGLCVAHVGEQYFVLADRCSHQNWPLSDGEVDPDALTVECTKHGSTFSLLDGRPQCLPATQAVAVYPVRAEGDEIVVSVPQGAEEEGR